MGKWVHRLSEVDLEARTAVCAHCGPVKFWYSSGRKPTCSIAKRERAKSAPSYGESRRKLPHGLTQRQAKEFVEGKACAICAAADDLCVDHDHASGGVRGALCRSCNSGLGMFRDDIELLKKAAEYLVSSSERRGY